MSDLSPQVKPGYHRHRYLVDRGLQLRLVFRLLAAVLFISLLAGAAMYLGAVRLVERQLYTPHLFHDSSGEFLWPLFLWLNLGLALLLVLGIAWLVRRYLAATAGSLGRLERHLEAFAAGGLPAPINFRRHDPLAPVAAASNEFIAVVRRRRLAAKGRLRELEKRLAALAAAPPESQATAAALARVAAEMAAARLALQEEEK